MQRDPALTYRGALQIFATSDQRTIDILDQLMNGSLLTDSAAPGSAEIVSSLEANEKGAGLFRELTAVVKEKLLGLSGFPRHEYLAATHTIITVIALYEGLYGALGRENYLRLELTDRERSSLRDRLRTENDKPRLSSEEVATRTSDYLLSLEPRRPARLLERMLANSVPMPSAAYSFEGNWNQRLFPVICSTTLYIVKFIESLEEDKKAKRDQGNHRSEGLPARIEKIASNRYKHYYGRLAADIPEFYVWSALDGQSGPPAVESSVHGILNDHSGKLDAIKLILECLNSESNSAAVDRETLAELYRSEMEEPIMKIEALPDDNFQFPSIRKAYITPRFRLAVSAESARIWQESWWVSQPLRTDLGAFITAYLTSPESSQYPLVILGHPGAGKSLLTKVIAAQLPSMGFLPAVVPLRRVNPRSPVHRQINETMSLFTHDRISWQDLVANDDSVTRVVFLDGLDELMQATGAVQSDFAADVIEYQNRELILGRPVAAIITSRTIVADRAQIPVGCPVIKLEEFDDQQVSAWLAEWRDANVESELRGQFRSLTLEAAKNAGELSRQPLLLTILAIYAANPGSADLVSGRTSSAQLYASIVDEFINRELRRENSRSRTAFNQSAIDDRFLQLAIASFSMFNRGVQFVDEESVDHDLDELLTPAIGAEAEVYEQMSRAQYVFGRFFFVHRMSSGDQSAYAGDRLKTVRRAYEFLHATFGEYLIARAIVDLILDEAELSAAAKRSRFVQDNYADGSTHQRLLEALLAHQPLVKRRNILDFVRELVAAEHEDKKQMIMEVLRGQLNAAQVSNVRPYINDGADAYQNLACYTCNIISLYVALSPNVSIEQLVEGEDPRARWRSLVRLWRAGLDDDGWNSLTTFITVREVSDDLELMLRSGSIEAPPIGILSVEDMAEIGEAELLNDEYTVLLLRLGKVVDVAAGGLSTMPPVELYEYSLAVLLAPDHQVDKSHYLRIADLLESWVESFSGSDEPPKTWVLGLVRLLITALSKDLAMLGGIGGSPSGRIVHAMQTLIGFGQPTSASADSMHSNSFPRTDKLRLAGLGREVDRLLRGATPLGVMSSVDPYVDI